MNIADKIINEPLGGAHNDEFMVYNSVKDVINSEYKYLKSLSKKNLVDERANKYNNIGVYKDE